MKKRVYVFGLKSINKSKINLIWLDKFSVKWERYATTGQTFPRSTLDSDRRCVFYFSAAFISSPPLTQPIIIITIIRFDIAVIREIRGTCLTIFFSSLDAAPRAHIVPPLIARWQRAKEGVFLAIWGGERRQLTKKTTQIRHFMHQKECEGPLYGVANLMWLLSRARDDIPSPNDVVFTLELVDFLLLLFGYSIAPSMVLASLLLQQQVQLSRSH